MISKTRQEIKHICKYNPERAAKDYWFLQDALEKCSEERRILQQQLKEALEKVDAIKGE